MIGRGWSLAQPRANEEARVFLHCCGAAIKRRQWGMRGETVIQRNQRRVLRVNSHCCCACVRRRRTFGRAEADLSEDAAALICPWIHRLGLQVGWSEDAPHWRRRGWLTLWQASRGGITTSHHNNTQSIRGVIWQQSVQLHLKSFPLCVSFVEYLQRGNWSCNSPKHCYQLYAHQCFYPLCHFISSNHCINSVYSP